MTALVGRRVRRYVRELRAFRNRYLDDYVFIHINKTGGSSIEKALKLPIEHKTVQEKIKEIGVRRWQKKFSFTAVRNPWDKVVSHYHYRVQTNQTNLKTNPVAFKDWVLLTYGDNNPFYYDRPKWIMPQVD